MKIVVIVRTRDEARRIGPFCEAYRWADNIIVSDGGSLDDTVAIASSFLNVSLRPFSERVKLANGLWRNNDSHHANFLIAAANELAPDWIIYDDCDCRPNRLLREQGRWCLETFGGDFAMAVRLYLWGTTQHFPHMAKPAEPHAKWEPSLWAWRGSLDFWTVDKPPAYDFRIGGQTLGDLHLTHLVLDLLPPFCLLHLSWDDPERVKQKVAFYRDSRFIPEMAHPLDFAGPAEPLPAWATE